MNEVLKVIKNRVSLRAYDDRQLTNEHIDEIINAAMLAPTAGNQMLYSIIIVQDNEKKKLLAKSCDNQAFIEKAPTIMLFFADQQKWFDYYMSNNVVEFQHKNNKDFILPTEADMLLAIEDAMIASQNAVIAAESLNIGSCYIGDIIENYEYIKDLLKLPDWVVPISMLTFGYYKENYNRTFKKRFDKKYVVFNEEYKKLTKEELKEMFIEKEKMFKENNPYGAKNFAQMFYSRKTGSEFSKEMARSTRELLKNFT